MMVQFKILILLIFVSLTVISQEHLTIQTNLKNIDFYNLKKYKVYRDFSDTINSNIDLRVFIFRKDKLKTINKTNKKELSLISESDWYAFLDRCKKAEQFDMYVYNEKGKEVYSFTYYKGKLNFVEPDIFPLDLNTKNLDW